MFFQDATDRLIKKQILRKAGVSQAEVSRHRINKDNYIVYICTISHLWLSNEPIG